MDPLTIIALINAGVKITSTIINRNQAGVAVSLEVRLDLTTARNADTRKLIDDALAAEGKA